jgi:hypothetical protein
VQLRTTGIGDHGATDDHRIARKRTGIFRFHQFDCRDAARIEEQLLFDLRATRHEDVFSGASAVDLVLLVRRAAQTMVDQGRTGDDDMATATDNLHTLLAAMDDRRVELGLREFHERTVSDALARLCPGFWPFC